MALIIDEKDIRVSFEHTWTSFVPGILSYAEKSRKKGVINSLALLQETGVFSA